MKEWILPTAGAFICWGIWGFLPKVTVKYIDPKSAAIYGVFGGILVAIIVFFLLKFRIGVNPIGISFAVATGFVGSLGALLFLHSVSKGPVSLIVTLSALYPVLSILLAVLFLNETISIRQGLGMILALAAMALIGF